MLGRALQALTAPALGASEKQPQGEEDSQGPEELLEQLDVEETEQAKLPRYLERFQVSCSRTGALSAVTDVLPALAADKRSLHALVVPQRH